MNLNKWLILLILFCLGLMFYFLEIYPVSAHYQHYDWVEVSPSPSVSPSPEGTASPEPSVSPEASSSATPTDAPRPGLTDPGPGGTSGSDGHCTYDPNRSACGGKDPVIPSAAPATGRGGS